MMRWIAMAALLALMIGLGGSASAQDEAPCCFDPCHAPFDRLLSDDVFSHYPAPHPASARRPAPPDVRRGDAHLYRTVIREQAKSGPDFAGHFTIIVIGCGAGVVCLAIADANTGQVFFPPELRNAEALLMDTGDQDIRALNYRRGSQLLIVVGTRNEDPKSTGMTSYVWRSGRLHLLRFVPVGELCKGG